MEALGIHGQNRTAEVKDGREGCAFYILLCASFTSSLRGSHGFSWVEELLGLKITGRGRDDSNVLGFLGLEEKLVMDGSVPYSDVVQRPAVRNHNCDKVLRERPLCSPWLAEGEDDIGFGDRAMAVCGVLEAGEEAVGIVEDFGSLLLGQGAGVSDGGGAVVDDSSAEGSEIGRAHV